MKNIIFFQRMKIYNKISLKIKKKMLQLDLLGTLTWHSPSGNLEQGSPCGVIPDIFFVLFLESYPYRARYSLLRCKTQAQKTIISSSSAEA